MKPMIFQDQTFDNSTPTIILDFDTLKFIMIGVSFPENVESFYGPIIELLESKKSLIEGKNIKVEVCLWYYNTASTKKIPQLLDAFCKAVGEGGSVKISWLCDDDDTDALSESRYIVEAMISKNFTFDASSVETKQVEADVEKAFKVKLKK